MVDNIKKNLTNIVVVIGLVGSIGAGFSKFAKMESTIEQLASQKTVDYSAQIAVIEEKVNALENIDTSHTHKLIDHDHPVEHSHTKPLVNAKEIELLKVQIEEIKVKTSNPLQ
jgi:hypothetical protein|tara:strand:- start:85 stop:423 length:339 start_codon:yes stop_codon:yes gene_type:complete